jgi:hypothetical protein
LRVRNSCVPKDLSLLLWCKFRSFDAHSIMLLLLEPPLPDREQEKSL